MLDTVSNVVQCVFQREDGFLHEGERDSARAASVRGAREWAGQPEVQVHSGQDTGGGGVTTQHRV